MVDDDTFTTALRQARSAETARLEALFAVHDARALRLEQLRDLLLPDLGASSRGNAMFSLNLDRGESPRLWLDLVAAVEMEPDPKTYRLSALQDKSVAVLFETADVVEAHDYALRYLARQQLLELEREAMADGGKKQAQRPATLPNLAVWQWALMALGGLALVAAIAAALALYDGLMKVQFG